MLDIAFLVDLLSRVVQFLIDIGGDEGAIAILEALIRFFGGGAA